MIMFRACSGHIYPVEVARVTAEFAVLPNGRRRKMLSDWDAWFGTWQEAHDYLLAKAVRAVEKTEKLLLYDREYLAKIEAMRDPTIHAGEKIDTGRG